jgi:hypothetical protein
MGTPSERVFGMALTLDDLGKEIESSLADGCVYRFGQFALDSRKRALFRADLPDSLSPKGLRFCMRSRTTRSVGKRSRMPH